MANRARETPPEPPSLFLPSHPQNRKQSRSKTIGVQRQKQCGVTRENVQQLVACSKGDLEQAFYRRHGQRSRGRERQAKNGYGTEIYLIICCNIVQRKKEKRLEDRYKREYGDLFFPISLLEYHRKLVAVFENSVVGFLLV